MRNLAPFVLFLPMKTVPVVMGGVIIFLGGIHVQRLRPSFGTNRLKEHLRPASIQKLLNGTITSLLEKTIQPVPDPGGSPVWRTCGAVAAAEP
jgi:hypothetical protein